MDIVGSVSDNRAASFIVERSDSVYQTIAKNKIMIFVQKNGCLASRIANTNI